MQDKILLAHGGGGLLTSALIDSIIAPRFANPVLDCMDDSAVLPVGGGRIAFTSDSYVVAPAFFPGGNIGDLAVCGTVNDLAMSGAEPQWLSLSLILEEGLPLRDLERILDAARARAQEAGVAIVCGDTKVVPQGEADGIYINTAGIGVLEDDVRVSATNARPGDRVLVSGVVGLHGLAVMLARGGFSLQTPVESDVAPLHAPVRALRDGGVALHCLRDITRGGLSMAVKDIAEASGVSIELDEAALPSHDAAAAACDLLGLDMLHLPCEGRFLAVVPDAQAEAALAILRAIPVAAQAAAVGRVNEAGKHPVTLRTPIGTHRVVTPPRGEELPRIC